MKRNRRSIFFIIAAIALWHSTAFCYSNIAAAFPFGLPLGPASGTMVNMGQTGVGILNDHNVMLANPANLGAINKTAFSSLLSIDLLRIQEESRNTDHIAVAPRQLAFAFPLGIIGTIGFALAKETIVRTSYQTPAASIEGSDFIGRISYSTKGGLTGWRIGWGYAIGKWAYIGAAYERLYFELNNTKIVDLASFNAITTRDSTHAHFSGNALYGGLMVPIAKATIGVAGRYIFEDDISYSRAQYRRTDSTTAIAGTAILRDANIKLPPYFAFGASYEFSPRWLVGADLGFEKWGSYSAHGLLPASDMEYALRFGTGARLIPAPDLLAPKYWETIHYRLGFKFWQLPRDGTSEFAFSLGTGFPVKGGGLLDLIATFGRRTDERFTDYSEDFVQIGIGINGGRKWTKVSPGNY